MAASARLVLRLYFTTYSMRFSIRDLLWVTAIAALAVGWWWSNRQSETTIERLNAELEIEKAKRQANVSLLERRYEDLQTDYRSLEAHYRFHMKAMKALSNDKK